MTWLIVMVTNDHGYVPLFVNTSRFFPRSWLITWFVTRVTRRVTLVEQELLTLPEHLSLPRFLMGSCYSIFSFICMFCRSLFVLLYFFFWPLCFLFFFDIRILYVCFVDRCLSFCTFSFGRCVDYSYSIYGFWLPLWYLQIILIIARFLVNIAFGPYFVLSPNPIIIKNI
jgi:hypothetical protein